MWNCPPGGLSSGHSALGSSRPAGDSRHLSQVLRADLVSLAHLCTCTATHGRVPRPAPGPTPAQKVGSEHSIWEKDIWGHGAEASIVNVLKGEATLESRFGGTFPSLPSLKQHLYEINGYNSGVWIAQPIEIC